MMIKGFFRVAADIVAMDEGIFAVPKKAQKNYLRVSVALCEIMYKSGRSYER